MATPVYPPVNNSAPNQSIWQHLNQSEFRQRIQKLMDKNDVPGKPMIHTYTAWRNRQASRYDDVSVLPFDVEERVANDIAFIAAARKDVKTVSAVALEEQNYSQGLTVRLSANGIVEAPVKDSLTSIFGLLQKCAMKGELRRRAQSFVVLHAYYLRALTRQMSR